MPKSRRPLWNMPETRQKPGKSPIANNDLPPKIPISFVIINIRAKPISSAAFFPRRPEIRDSMVAAHPHRIKLEIKFWQRYQIRKQIIHCKFNIPHFISFILWNRWEYKSEIKVYTLFFRIRCMSNAYNKSKVPSGPYFRGGQWGHGPPEICSEIVW